MSIPENISLSFRAALPIVFGYIAIGIPCGILSASMGLNLLQVFLLSLLFYSGAGQFMLPNMWLAGVPLPSIVASISLVNTRQMLYSASLAPYSQNTKKPLAFIFAATVTDESYGINMAQFQEGGWSLARATLVNIFSHTSWILSCLLGVVIGNAISIPLAIASFAMTSIFICLLFTQKYNTSNLIAALASVFGVIVCKILGINGPAILIGALFGVAVALVSTKLLRSKNDLV